MSTSKEMVAKHKQLEQTKKKIMKHAIDEETR